MARFNIQPDIIRQLKPHLCDKQNDREALSWCAPDEKLKAIDLSAYRNIHSYIPFHTSQEAEFCHAFNSWYKPEDRHRAKDSKDAEICKKLPDAGILSSISKDCADISLSDKIGRVWRYTIYGTTLLLKAWTIYNIRKVASVIKKLLLAGGEKAGEGPAPVSEADAAPRLKAAHDGLDRLAAAIEGKDPRANRAVRSLLKKLDRPRVTDAEKLASVSNFFHGEEALAIHDSVVEEHRQRALEQRFPEALKLAELSVKSPSTVIKARDGANDLATKDRDEVIELGHLLKNIVSFFPGNLSNSWDEAIDASAVTLRKVYNAVFSLAAVATAVGPITHDKTRLKYLSPLFNYSLSTAESAVEFAVASLQYDADWAKVAIKIQRLPHTALSGQAGVDLFFIMREAISNALEHAYPEKASASNGRTISIASPEDGSFLSIMNNGRSFNADEAMRAPSPTSGISFMRRLAERNGGKLIVESTPKGGTEIIIILSEALAKAIANGAPVPRLPPPPAGPADDARPLRAIMPYIPTDPIPGRAVEEAIDSLIEAGRSELGGARLEVESMSLARTLHDSASGMDRPTRLVKLFQSEDATRLFESIVSDFERRLSDELIPDASAAMKKSAPSAGDDADFALLGARLQPLDEKVGALGKKLREKLAPLHKKWLAAIDECEKLFGKPDAATAERVKAVASHVETVISNIKKLASLNFSRVDSLIAAAKWLNSGNAKNRDVSINIAKLEITLPVPDHIQKELLRTIHEVIRGRVDNSDPKADYRLIDVDGKLVGNEITLQISDNGKGTAADIPTAASGAGKQHGWQIAYTPVKGHGMSVTIKIDTSKWKTDPSAGPGGAGPGGSGAEANTVKAKVVVAGVSPPNNHKTGRMGSVIHHGAAWLARHRSHAQPENEGFLLGAEILTGAAAATLAPIPIAPALIF
ncbi:MAG: ATP-binding protein [Pseudomonadota bacterium]